FSRGSRAASTSDVPKPRADPRLADYQSPPLRSAPQEAEHRAAIKPPASCRARRQLKCTGSPRHCAMTWSPGCVKTTPSCCVDEQAGSQSISTNDVSCCEASRDLLRDEPID